MSEATLEGDAAESERRTSALELFFDLVFVFAITQVTSLVSAHPTASGFAHGALVLGLVFWAWSAYSWTTTSIDVQSVAGRVGLLLAAAGSLLMSFAVPESFGDLGLWFAAAYFGVRTLQIVLVDFGLRHEPVLRAGFRWLAPWFVLAPAVVLGGGFLHGHARFAVWAASLAIDVGSTLFVPPEAFRISPAHFAERYSLFVIIALGESLVAIGVGAASGRRDAALAGAILTAFAGVAILWWAYFDYIVYGAERVLRRSEGEARIRLARDVFSFGHFPLIAGIILFAVAAKKAVAHPGDPLSGAGRFALGMGIGLYLLGFVAMRLRLIRRLAYERAAALVVCAVLCAAVRGIPGTALMLACEVVLVVALALEMRRLGDLRVQIRAGA